jgi:putative transcriptional regulator
MKIELSNNYKGKCLVAMPSMQDQIFAQSVVYITEHSNASGAVGVIINKHLVAKQEESKDFGFRKYNNQWSDIPVYFGGPVELNTGFVLHQTSDQKALTLTGSRQKIDKLAAEDKVKPFMLAAGYCVWESFQLEREIRMNSWIVLDDVAEHLLGDVNPQERYQEALKLSGISSLAFFDFSEYGNA